jgi:two-component system response regulator (stage 0 sporulation protein A)
MHSKVRVLIIDDNQNLIERVKQYFRNHAVINIISEAHDGKEGLDIILKEQSFNLILLDLVMPNKDGIYLLEELKKRNQSLDIIVISGLGEEEVIRKTCSYGVKYFILKPFDIKDLEKRILDFIYYKEKFDVDKLNMECILIKLLHSLGIPSHIKGYQYLKEGICLLYNNPLLTNHIMKDLYPKIALKYNTNVNCVEKSIRHALEIGWNRGDYKLMEEIFGHSISFNKTKPTNLEFMVTIVDKLKIDMAKIK